MSSYSLLSQLVQTHKNNVYYKPGHSTNLCDFKAQYYVAIDLTYCIQRYFNRNILLNL